MHPETARLVEELQESMIVNDEMKDMSPEQFWDAVRLAKMESFAVACVLLNFLTVHGQYNK